jgi:hypothetical protein
VGRLDDRAGCAVAEVTPSQTKAASPIAEVLAEMSEQESLAQVEINAHTEVAKTGHFRIGHADGFVNRRGPFRDGRNSPKCERSRCEGRRLGLGRLWGKGQTTCVH